MPRAQSEKNTVNQKKLTYSHILKYLKNLVSNKERYIFEKQTMQDPFDAEAMEGLSELSAENFEADVVQMQRQLNKRIARSSKGERQRYYAMAASALVLFGLAVVFFMLNKTEAPYEIVDRSQERTDAVVVTGIEEDSTGARDQLFKTPNIDFSVQADEAVVFEEVGTAVKKPKESKKMNSSDSKDFLDEPIMSPANENVETVYEETSISELKTAPELEGQSEAASVNRRAKIMAKPATTFKQAKTSRSISSKSTQVTPSIISKEAMPQIESTVAMAPQKNREAYKEWLIKELNDAKFPENEIHIVDIRFLITKNGRLEQIEITNSPNAAARRELKRVIKLGENWIPATNTNNGQAIASWVQLELRLEF